MAANQFRANVEENPKDQLNQSYSPEIRSLDILIAEEHEPDGQGLQLLVSEYSRVQVVGIAKTPFQAVVSAVQVCPDVVLLDFQFHLGRGVEVCQDLLACNRESKVLFLSYFEDSESVLEAMKVGASGYLSKNIDAKSLIQAIELIVFGQIFINSKVLHSIQSLLQGRDHWAQGYLSIEQRRVLDLVTQTVV